MSEASWNVPEGYALVKIEPTRRMIAAAARVEEDGYAAMLQAMIQSSPAPPAHTEHQDDGRFARANAFSHLLNRLCKLSTKPLDHYVVSELFASLKRSGLISNFVQTKSGFGAVGPMSMTLFESKDAFDGALLQALSELYEWHLNRLSRGDINDGWYLRYERVAMYQLLKAFEDAGHITFSLDHADEAGRGVRLASDQSTPNRSQRQRPTM